MTEDQLEQETLGDTLLPRLISGQRRLREVEAAAPVFVRDRDHAPLGHRKTTGPGTRRSRLPTGYPQSQEHRLPSPPGGRREQ